MKQFEPDQNLASDERVEALLRGFFEQELPDELPPLPVARRRPTAATPRHSAARWLVPALAAAASIAVFAAWGLWSSTANRSADQPVARGDQPVADVVGPVGPQTPKSSSVSNEPVLQAPQTDAPSPAELDYSIVEARQPLERFVYDTGTGPVEQRADMRWTTVTVYEPQSGERAVWTVPELTIEVVAVDQP